MKISYIDFIEEIIAIDKIYIKPNIPQTKAINAINSYARDLNYEDIVVLVDDTVFGGCKDGMIFSDLGIFAKQAFENPICYEIFQIKNFFMDKGIINNKIILNNQRISLTLPDAKTLDNLIRKYNEYKDHLYQLLESECEKQQDINKKIDDKNEEARRELAELEEELIQQIEKERAMERKNEMENKIKTEKEIEMKSIDDEGEISIFYRSSSYPDKMIDAIKTRTNLGYSIIMSIGISDSEFLVQKIVNCLLNTTLIIRNDYIDKFCINGLKNDISTINTIIYVTQIMNFELIRRGLEEKFVRFVITDSINNLFMVDRYPNNNRLSSLVIDSLLEDSLLEDLLLKDSGVFFSYIYAIRLLISLEKGKVVQANFFEEEIFESMLMKYKNDDLIGNLETAEDLLYFLTEGISRDIYNEIGYVPPIGYLLEEIRREVGDIYQFARKNSLI